MLTLLVGSSAAAPVCTPDTPTPGVTTCVFAYTGARDEWVVPAGVTTATFDLNGAAGGRVAGFAPMPGGAGGEGAHVQATLVVTAGATYYLRVGGRGQDGESLGSGSGPGTVAGGFNGGGTNTLTDTCIGCGFVGGAGEARATCALAATVSPTDCSLRAREAAGALGARTLTPLRSPATGVTARRQR